jgi:hypothetical protein
MENARARWLYAVEITSDFKGLKILRDDIAAYLRQSRPKHAIAFERPARVIVRFAEEQAARNFYYTFNGRFISL